MLARTHPLAALAIVLLTAASPDRVRFAQIAADDSSNTRGQLESDGGWQPLFNGRDLTGWTPKIKGYELGDNFANTFRVEDGLLKIRYDGYDTFNSRFGHLYYKNSFSRYRLRVEYRFVGEQIAGGPDWAVRNSGVMFHGQSPETIGLEQEFPVSIEAQFLGGDGTNKRPTLNMCSPGTHIEMDGKLITQHCVDSNSQTYHGDQWVTVELEVHGNDLVRHLVDGKVVLEYTRPQYDPNDESAKPLIKDGQLQISSGTISLQSESHPIDFRKVEILLLDANALGK